jgi:hypothetical protein
MSSKYEWASWAIVAAWSAAVTAGCGGVDEEAATEEPNGADVASGEAADRGFDAYALAWEYKHGARDPSAPTRVLDTIRALTLEDARAFHRALADINDITGEPLRYFQAGFEVAAEHGVSFMDLDAEMRAEAFRRAFSTAMAARERRAELSTEPHVLDDPQPFERAEVEKAICLPPFTSCAVDPNFDNGYAMFGASCAGGCIPASRVDRTSNESCELLGCDYRVTFPAPLLKLIGGRTPDGECAVGTFPRGIGAYSTGSATLAVLGFNSLFLNCGISGNEVKASLFQAFE